MHVAGFLNDRFVKNYINIELCFSYHFMDKSSDLFNESVIFMQNIRKITFWSIEVERLSRVYTRTGLACHPASGILLNRLIFFLNHKLKTLMSLCHCDQPQKSHSHQCEYLEKLHVFCHQIVHSQVEDENNRQLIPSHNTVSQKQTLYT